MNLSKKAQAAVELAVFGAILIFLLGAIVRSAVGNSYTQNQNFKAMRMAMLASWNGSKAQNVSRNSASILFIEDRLSPDFNKYGDLDRNPYIASGSGTFSYMLLYPLASTEVSQNLPVMDVYINGQHFPFTTAAYVTNTMTRPASCPYPAGSCAQNQCLRNQREWVGGTVAQNQLESVIQVPLSSSTDAIMASNASAIFNALVAGGEISAPPGATAGIINLTALPPTFSITSSTGSQVQLSQAQINSIESILQSNQSQYKLFYSMGVNQTDQFSPSPPSCVNPNTLACKDKALSSTLQVTDASGNLFTNTNGEMEYDLQRLGNYAAVDSQFPVGGRMRNLIAWQWTATAGTSESLIGLDALNNQYPAYDIDGRLKTVTIYNITVNSGIPTVTYEDYAGGDIDSTWDTNSCGSKPGLQNESQIFTFTKNAQNSTNGGTYLQIKEGQLYNPETNQFVRSANKRDTIDIVQRTIQLSNNTGRFCSGGTPLATVANDGVTPNPVEVCVSPGSGGNCFTGSNSNGQIIAQTCFDENDNMLFVRSRLEDRRGHFWMTNASGQLKVQR